MSDLKINLQEILQEKQEKIIPENIKKDVQIFDVTGTYEGSGSSGEGDVKLFETEEEMQADSTAQEGDLAVVYREEIQNMTANTETQYITFPETVVLPEAFVGDAYCMLRAVDESAMFDGQVMLNQSMFDFNGYSETGMIRVNYQSEDGITYTRQEFMGDSGALTNPVDLGVVIGAYSSEEWNDMLGYFMQAGGNVFDGLYEYKARYVDDNLIHFILIPSITFDVQDDSITNVNFDYTDISYDVNKINICLNKMKTDGIFTKVFPSKLYVGTDGGLYVYIDTTGFDCAIGYDEDKSCLGFIGAVDKDCILDVYKLDLENGTYEESEPITFSDTILNYSSIILRVANTNNINTVPVSRTGNGISIYTDLSLYCKNSNNSIKYLKRLIDCRITKGVYITAPNQYTLTSSNQLLPNISAYGKNGNVVGDGSIYDNIGMSTMLSKISGADLSTLGYTYAYNGNELSSDSYSLLKKPLKVISGNKNFIRFKMLSKNNISGLGVFNDKSVLYIDSNSSGTTVTYYNLATGTSNVLDTISGSNNSEYVEIQVNSNLGYILLMSRPDAYLKVIELKDNNATVLDTLSISNTALDGYSVVLGYYVKGCLWIVIKNSGALKFYTLVNNKITEQFSDQSVTCSNNANEYMYYNKGLDCLQIGVISSITASSEKYLFVKIDLSSETPTLTTNSESATSDTRFSNSKYVLIGTDNNLYLVGEFSGIYKVTDLDFSKTSYNYKNMMKTEYTFDVENNVLNGIFGIKQNTVYDINTGKYTYKPILSDEGTYGEYLDLGGSKLRMSSYNRSLICLEGFANDNSIVYVDSDFNQFLYSLYDEYNNFGGLVLSENLNNVEFSENTSLFEPSILRVSDLVAVGVIETDYTGTISPEEYNTALDTSEQILGEEETVNE